MWTEQLITLYCTVCRHYNSGISEQVQRFSNNSRPKFTDEEAMTVYLWGILQRRFEVKALYQYTRMHLLDWFPKLPSYQAFVNRLNALSPAFCTLAERLIDERRPDASDMEVYLIDSLPVLLAKGSRSNRAKVARELCAKTYNASRDQWYYGVKLHIVGQKRRHSLPFPKLIFASQASCHDLPVAKQPFENRQFSNYLLAGDKAYSDADWVQSLAQAGIQLLTPSKLKRGQALPLPGGDAQDTSISRLRQSIEAFFNWLQEKTNIQLASKVRSTKGLLLHIFGRISAALLAFNS